MSVNATAPFDPSAEVPDEYDVFCEACGYSLAGLTGDRCPECGAAFEPKELPFARIPWLHRKRLGMVNAYMRTVLMVCFSPAGFARELCRPVRVSAADARKFRLLTIHLVTAVAFLGAIGLIGMFVLEAYGPRGRGVWLSPIEWIFFVGIVLSAPVALHLFLRLATDMPLFIWKGHPSLKPIELSPVHQYACAPLAILPATAALSVFLMYLWASAVLDWRTDLAVFAIVVSLIVPVWLWVVALVLMRVSTNPRPRRLLLLALYLPLHWLVMLAMCWMLWVLVIAAMQWVAMMLHVRTNMFR